MAPCFNLLYLFQFKMEGFGFLMNLIGCAFITHIGVSKNYVFEELPW
jgi:hypothetical protein